MLTFPFGRRIFLRAVLLRTAFTGLGYDLTERS